VDQFNVTFSQEIDTNGFLGVNFEYLLRQTGKSLKYKVNFLSIIEYAESGATAGYQPAQDSIVQIWKLSNGLWNPWYGPYFGDGSSLAFNTSTSDGILSVSGFVANSPTFLTQQSYQLHPNEVKMNLGVDFRSIYKSRTGQSVLAIEVHIISSSPISKDSSSITIDGDQPGVFKWPNTAKTENGASVNVLATDLAQVSTTEWKMYFTLNSTERTSFEWDPAVSIINNPPVEERSAAVSSAITGVQVLFLLVLVFCAYL
jgi:hypothetical protein